MLVNKNTVKYVIISTLRTLNVGGGRAGAIPPLPSTFAPISQQIHFRRYSN